MKKFIAIIAAAGLVLTMSGIAMSEDTGNRTVTQVSAISEPGANWNPGALIVDQAAICSVPNMVADADIIYDYKLLSVFLPAEADAIDLAAARGMTRNIGTADLESGTGNNMATAYGDGGPRPTTPQRPETATSGS